jgi:CRISPR-associated protein Csm3
MSNNAHLRGRIFITCNIQALTGLHIGGSSTGLEIGGVDNTIIRDALSGAPYIPGSSLRGKMRSQLEKTLGLPQNNRVGQVKIHTCKTAQEYDNNGGCPVCHIFGVPGEVEAAGPTLLVVRDVALSEGSKESLNKAHTDLAYTELKTEVAIDRVTSAATPRTLERVPAGAVFGPAELVFSIYQPADFGRLRHVVDGLQLLEDDYLGGYGSRGSGKVRFQEITVSARFGQKYGELQTFKTFATLQELEAAYAEMLAWSKSVIAIPAE